MPAVAENAVVHPVGRLGARRVGRHRDKVHEEHHQREYRQAQPAVGHYLVDLIRYGQSALLLLFVNALEHIGYADVALVGDYGFGVVVKLLLGGLYVLFDMVELIPGYAQLFDRLLVALEKLYGVPPLTRLGHIVQHVLLDMRQSVLDRSAEGVLRNGAGALRGLDRGLGGLVHARALQRGNLHYPAAQSL